MIKKSSNFEAGKKEKTFQGERDIYLSSEKKI
jgi:hypothetical protein